MGASVLGGPRRRGGSAARPDRHRPDRSGDATLAELDVEASASSTGGLSAGVVHSRGTAASGASRAFASTGYTHR